MSTRVETDKDIEPESFAAELAARAGLEELPAITYRPPGQPDGDGGELPGVIVVDADLAHGLVDEVIADHAPPPAPETASTSDDLRARAEAADTLEALRSVVVDLIANTRP